MPTYEYFCTACDCKFEEFQSIASEPIQICPKCKEKTVKRKISGGTGLIFKGSGFYITDYKKKSTGSDSPPVKEDKKSGSSNETKSKVS
jgi:putative FmdB family regulatory protein